MSLEAFGDEGDGVDGYVTDERAYEMIGEALISLAERMREIASSSHPVPEALKNVPFVALLAVANWIDPPNE